MQQVAVCCNLWCGVGIIETAEGGKKPKNLDGRRRRKRGEARHAKSERHWPASTGMIDIATETYPNAERHPTSYRYLLCARSWYHKHPIFIFHPQRRAYN